MDKRISKKDFGRESRHLAAIDYFGRDNYIGVSGSTFQFLRL